MKSKVCSADVLGVCLQCSAIDLVNTGIKYFSLLTVSEQCLNVSSEVFWGRSGPWVCAEREQVICRTDSLELWDCSGFPFDLSGVPMSVSG